MTIEYQQTLGYSDGQFTLRFPMTISPRYLPPKELILEFSETGWSQEIGTEVDAEVNEESPNKSEPGKGNVSLKVKLNVGFAL